ncbi:MAG: NUDIX domain-containing protein [Pseudomonadales bacterium]|nr:NUDIX domain-containing protein [Pseudomonadales bacterium]MBO6597218.1 NUDIX domain-containing protein [Pseudomonadales bacterium]MBO6823596.1 NUDIX domain-containing protein [Pseudomonadales bacterium]
MNKFKFCPMCAAPLFEKAPGRIECSMACGFVNYDNPTPVAAVVVEYQGSIVLAHNRAWKVDFYGLITGFVDHGEGPAECAVREVKEELDLDAEPPSLIGVYPFEQLNQVIIGYHVRAAGDITLNEELDRYQLVSPDECVAWSTGTGFALRDWLRSKGIEPEMMKLP